MGLTLRLLGPPGVIRDGSEVTPPRGRKGWALLAYLLLSRRPVSRTELAELLFPDADDPFAALRWTLSELRRVLGPDGVIEGEPVRIELSADALVDALVVAGGAWESAIDLPGLGLPLLEGVAPSASAAFELWVESERHRLQGAAEAALHAAAHAALARGDVEEAMERASRLAKLNPLDENHHILLIRCHKRMGRQADARRHHRRAVDILRAELAVEPSPALEQALHEDEPPTPASAPAIEARLQRGEATVAAGALEEGLRLLRSACAAARTSDDRTLLARALLALGDALVHAARGGDEEGAAALGEAALLADLRGERAVAAAARRELAIVELYRARYERVRELLAEAGRLAGDDDAELAWVELLMGGTLSDLAEYGQAATLLQSATERARRAGTHDAAAFAWAFVGRIDLLRRDLSAARVAIERSLAATRTAAWTAFLPFPEALLGEVDLLEGDASTAGERFEHAFALGRELDDPCWEAIAARGLGLVADANGDEARALDLLGEAPRMCRRLPDSSRWIEAYALDAACWVAIRTGSRNAAVWVTELETLAARAGLRELVVRAIAHRAALGDSGAAEAAHLLASGIDSPALHYDLASIAASHAASHGEG